MDELCNCCPHWRPPTDLGVGAWCGKYSKPVVLVTHEDKPNDQRWTFVYNQVPPSMNVYVRLNRYPRNDLTQRWKHDIASLCRVEGIPHLDRVHLSAVLYFETRRGRDTDNYIVLWKLVQDGLTFGGVLPNDTSEHVTFSPPAFALDPALPRSEITLISSH